MSFRLTVTIADEEGTRELDGRTTVQTELGPHRPDAIPRAKEALRAALALVWGDLVFEEFGPTE